MRILRILFVFVLLFAPRPAHAQDWRLQFASSLAEDPATEEEAFDALRSLSVEPDGAAARAALRALVIRADPRPGWLDAYRELATDANPADRERLRLRAAEASTWVPSAQMRAREDLRRRLAKAPGDASAQFHFARACMVTGRPAEALRWFGIRPDQSACALGAHLARVALEPGESLAASATEIALGGYPELAAWLVGRVDPRASDAEAWRARGDGWVRRGRLADAVADYGRALAKHPDDAALRVALTHAWLARGDTVRAAETAGGVPEAERLVRAVELAESSPAEALRLAPGEQAVIRASAAALSKAGDAAAGLAVLRTLPDEPLTDETLDVVTRVAIAGGEPDFALQAWRRAVARASGPGRRMTLADGLAALHGEVAEAAKAKGDLATAERAWRTSLEMRPDWPWCWGGLGGVLWQAGRLEEARAAYLAALGRGSGTMAAGWRTAAAELSLSLGDLDAAEQLAIGAPGLERLRARVRAWRVVKGVDALPEAQRPAALLAAVRAAPADTELARLAAGRLLALGRAEDAVRLWTDLLARLPTDTEVALGLAEALAAAGDFDGARDALAAAESAPAAARERVRAAILRAEGDHLWRVDGRAGEALTRYDEALHAAPDAWTFAALGALYLGHDQPRAALACFDAALARDPGNVVAAEGRVRALAQAGEWDEARRAAASDARLASAIAAAEEQAALAEVASARERGDIAEARSLLRDAERRWPDSWRIGVEAARISLAAGDPMAYALAERVAAPDRVEALAVLVDAAEATRSWAAAEAWLGGKSGAAVQHAREELRFRASLAGAVAMQTHGAARRARARLDEARVDATDDADREARLGGAWLAIGEPERARGAYERALRLQPGHPAATAGIASAYEAEGRFADAQEWLAGREPPSARTLPLVSVAVGTEEGGGVPAVRLASLAGAASQAARHRGPVSGGAFVGAFGRDGAAGDGELSGQVGGVAGEWPVGTGVMSGQAMIVALDDGVDADQAVAPALGFRTRPGAQLSGVFWAGTTPVGGAVPATVVAYADVRYRLTHRLNLGVELQRLPMTDSAASWIGDASGTWGRTTFDALGLSAGMRTASEVEVEVGARAGWLRGLSLEPVARREANFSVGRRFGDQHWVRPAVTLSALAHDRQVDGFGPGGAGIFAPLAYGLLRGELDGGWAFASGVGLCGGARGGVEMVDGTPSARLSPGVHPAYGGTVGASSQLGGGWTAGFYLRYDAVTGWSDRAGGLWLRLGPTVAAAPVSGMSAGGCG